MLQHPADQDLSAHMQSQRGQVLTNNRGAALLRSMNMARAAPRLSASMPTAPVPA